MGKATGQTLEQYLAKAANRAKAFRKTEHGKAYVERYNKEYYLTHKESLRAYKREWQRKHRAEQKANRELLAALAKADINA